MHKKNKSKIVKPDIMPKIVDSVGDVDSVKDLEITQDQIFLLPQATEYCKEEIPNSVSNNNFCAYVAVDDFNKMIEHYAERTNDTISFITETMNINTNFIEQFCIRCTTTIDHSIQQNVKISKDILQCKDLTDAIDLRHKIVDSRTQLFSELLLGWNNITQEFIAKKLNNYNRLS
jgi:hypothetical protein